MYPILVTLGSVALPSWHVLFALGAVQALVILRYSSLKLYPHISLSHLNQFFASAYVGGYFGARGLSILIEEPDIIGISSFMLALLKPGSMTFYGGAIGAAFAGVAYLIVAKESVKEFADLGALAGFSGLFLGRIGCFLNGDDFGSVVGDNALSAPWWSVSFPNLADNLYRHPVQLYESLYSLLSTVLFFRVAYLSKGGFWKPGYRAMAIFCSYAIFRFFIEYLRGDPRGWIIEDYLSPSQFISLLILACCALIVALFPRRRSETFQRN